MKIKFAYRIILINLLLFLYTPLIAKVWINELMQSNVDELFDDLHDYPDSWIELYNDGEEVVDIKNWYVSLSDDYVKGWKITSSVKIPSKGYLIIYCDKVGKGLHTDFRLESGKGGSIYLFDSTHELIDSFIDIPKQPVPNIALGRVTDGKEKWGYFIKATPGMPNTGNMSNKLPPDPVFNIKGGVYQSPMVISLSLPKGTPSDIKTENIYYTLDGSEPTINSKVYTSSFTVSEPTIVRAKVIVDDYLISRSLSQSYIIREHQQSLPVLSIGLNPEYLWDEDFGIYVVGSGKYGISGNGVTYKTNWNNNWRRPMNVEYFPVTDEKGMNQLGELRIGGGWSRAHAQKTLILYANKRFGEKRYSCPIFQNKPNLTMKSFMLRNSGNDFGYTHFRDGIIQLFVADKIDVDYQAYQPVALYINGEYFGIQNIRERSQEDFVYANYNIEDIDVIENWTTAKTGDLSSFNLLMNKLQQPLGQIALNEIKEEIDVTEFINLFILNIYVGNIDFPANNFIMWRPRSEGSKWRFILKDLDHGLGLLGKMPDMNMFESYFGEDKSRLLFTRLMSDTIFKEEFTTRFAVYLGDIFHYGVVSSTIDSISAYLEEEMKMHIQRWKDTIVHNTMDKWWNEIDFVRNWCYERNNYIYKQLDALLEEEGLVEMGVNIPLKVADDLLVSINEVPLSQSGFSGKYFKNKEIVIDCKKSEAKVLGWEIKVDKGSKTESTQILDKRVSYLIPRDCERVDFNMILDLTDYKVNWLEDIPVYSNNEGIVIENLKEKSNISLYTIRGEKIAQVVTGKSHVFIPVSIEGIIIVSIMNDSEIINKKILK